MGEQESVAAGDDLDTRSHAINERVVGDVTGMLSMSSSLHIHIHHTHTHTPLQLLADHLLNQHHHISQWLSMRGPIGQNSHLI